MLFRSIPQLDAGDTAGLEVGAPKELATGGIPERVPVKRAVPLNAAANAGTPEWIGGKGIVIVGESDTGIIMRLENVATGLGRAHKTVDVADDPVSVRRGADRRHRCGRLPRSMMFLFRRGTPGTSGVRTILSGTDDNGDDRAHIAVGLVLADEHGPVCPFLGLAGHKKRAAVNEREMQHAIETYKIRVVVALAI